MAQKVACFAPIEPSTEAAVESTHHGSVPTVAYTDKPHISQQQDMTPHGKPCVSVKQN
jgi:hypothetical protein